MKSLQIIFGVAVTVIIVLAVGVFVANKNTNAVIANINKKIAKLNKKVDLKSESLVWKLADSQNEMAPMKRDLADLRSLMIENQREIDSIKNAFDIAEAMEDSQITRDSFAAKDSRFSRFPKSNSVFSEDSNQVSDEISDEISREKRREEARAMMTAELERFEATLTDEQRAEWARRVDERLGGVFEEGLSRVPEGLREMVRAQIQSGMDELKETTKYPVLQSMLSEMQMRESWEKMKQNPEALERIQRLTEQMQKE